MTTGIQFAPSSVNYAYNSKTKCSLFSQSWQVNNQYDLVHLLYHSTILGINVTNVGILALMPDTRVKLCLHCQWALWWLPRDSPESVKLHHETLLRYWNWEMDPARFGHHTFWECGKSVREDVRRSAANHAILSPLSTQWLLRSHFFIHTLLTFSLVEDATTVIPSS